MIRYKYIAVTPRGIVTLTGIMPIKLGAANLKARLKDSAAKVYQLTLSKGLYVKERVYL